MEEYYPHEEAQIEGGRRGTKFYYVVGSYSTKPFRGNAENTNLAQAPLPFAAVKKELDKGTRSLKKLFEDAQAQMVNRRNFGKGGESLAEEGRYRWAVKLQKEEPKTRPKKDKGIAGMTRKQADFALMVLWKFFQVFGPGVEKRVFDEDGKGPIKERMAKRLGGIPTRVMDVLYSAVEEEEGVCNLTIADFKSSNPFAQEEEGEEVEDIEEVEEPDDDDDDDEDEGIFRRTRARRQMNSLLGLGRAFGGGAMTKTDMEEFLGGVLTGGEAVEDDVATAVDGGLSAIEAKAAKANFGEQKSVPKSSRGKKSVDYDILFGVLGEGDEAVDDSPSGGGSKMGDTAMGRRKASSSKEEERPSADEEPTMYDRMM